MSDECKCGFDHWPLPCKEPGKLVSSELLAWLRAKLADAKHSVRAREEEESTWRGGTEEAWRAVGCKLNKRGRLEVAERAARILAKCRREVENFEAVIEIVSQPNEGDES